MERLSITLDLSLILLVAITATLAAPLLSALDEQALDDPEITRAVKDTLAAENGVDARRLEVSTRDGIVTLAGTARSLLEKEWAATAAETIRGVRSVIDRIQVDVVHRPDAEVAADVREAFGMDPAIDGSEVSASCSGGIVTLSGEVDSSWERRLCAKLAQGVRGVREVTNEIRVDLELERPDPEIAAEVRRRWELSPWINERALSVSVEDGQVRLSGVAGSAAERSNAHRFSYVAGVRGIDSSAVEVDPEKGRKLRRTSPHVVKSDEQLERDVRDSLGYDPRVGKSAIRVEARSGSVTLSGSVETLAVKKAADDDARNTVGVLRVENDLVVRPRSYPKDDAEVERAVSRAFARDPYLSDDSIEVEVRAGALTLRGHVDSTFEKEYAGTVADSLRWIREVENRLAVRPVAEVAVLSDVVLRRKVAERLYWNPFLDSSRITAKVEDGKVLLSGEVEDYHEFAQASKAARDAGAVEVENLLEVKRSSTPPREPVDAN